MITLQQVLAITNRHKQALMMTRRPDASPEAAQAAEARWAFLVTMEEIGSLVDEIERDPTALGAPLDATHAQYIREGRAMLHLNDVPILPELILASDAQGAARPS